MCEHTMIEIWSDGPEWDRDVINWCSKCGTVTIEKHKQYKQAPPTKTYTPSGQK